MTFSQIKPINCTWTLGFYIIKRGIYFEDKNYIFKMSIDYYLSAYNLLLPLADSTRPHTYKRLINEHIQLVNICSLKFIVLMLPA